MPQKNQTQMATASPYTPPAKPPTWRLSKKEILTLLLFMALFACALTVSHMRARLPEPPTPQTTKIIQESEEVESGHVYKKLRVEGLFGQENLNAKVFYACPETGCPLLLPIDRLLKEHTLALTYEGFMGLHLNLMGKLMPVAERNEDGSIKTIALVHADDAKKFLNQVISEGFKEAAKKKTAYVISTDQLVEFIKTEAPGQDAEEQKNQE